MLFDVRWIGVAVFMLMVFNFQVRGDCRVMLCGFNQTCVTDPATGKSMCVDMPPPPESGQIFQPVFIPRPSRPGGVRHHYSPSVHHRAFSGGVGRGIGLTPGGAQDINNFRKNIAEGYLPLPQSITYEGLYGDYFFNATVPGRQPEQCAGLLCPNYHLAVTKNPLGLASESYASVGLESNIPEVKRPEMDLVIVLDISGSMMATLNKYYYDFPHKKWVKNREGESKLNMAKNNLILMSSHLTPTDNIGLITFNHKGYERISLGKFNHERFQNVISGIRSSGGTSLEAGLNLGYKQFKDIPMNPARERRIILMTDMQINKGKDTELHKLIKKKANEEKIHLTTIGIGVDFNPELTELLQQVPGGNYFSIHNNLEFKDRFHRLFDYMVTPLLFNVTMTLDSETHKVEQVFGIPEGQKQRGAIFKIHTLFPSETTKDGIRGGVILVHMANKNPLSTSGGKGTIHVAYTKRDGGTEKHSKALYIPPRTVEMFESKKIRKAVLLKRFVDLMKRWLHQFNRTRDEGLSRWERRSRKLVVNPEMKTRMRTFRDHFIEEMKEIGDKNLAKEKAVLDKLLSAPDQ